MPMAGQPDTPPSRAVHVSAPLDAEIAAALVEMSAALPSVELTELPPDVARALYLDRHAWLNTGEPACEVTHISPDRAEGRPGGRPYRAETCGRGLIVYLHGGGWMFGSAESHDSLLRALAHGTGGAVLAVDYRLAPELPYPAPLEGCVAAFRWAVSQATSLGLDPDLIGVAGDSAGANLASATCLELEGSFASTKAALLLYGCYEPSFDTESHRAFGDGRFGVTTERMRRFWRNDLGDSPLPSNLAVPMGADLSLLPPSFLCVGELDPLRDETIAFAERLTAFGVQHEFKRHPGCHHGFLQFTSWARVAREAVQDLAAFWNRACAGRVEETAA